MIAVDPAHSFAAGRLSAIQRIATLHSPSIRGHFHDRAAAAGETEVLMMSLQTNPTNR
jgi:hypothetical protein